MNGIGFINMKVFKEQQWFDFKNITLITGTNNSGKSSIINAMQMLQENIKAKNIDDLIKTEFKLSSNLNKYGSIANFVNNEANHENNNFIFIRQIKNVEYRVMININQGLESYGCVKCIYATDLLTKSQIFTLLVEKPYPDYECIFNINYKYFIDRFNKKCENTEKLRYLKIELDEFSKEVNKGKKSIDELKEFAADIRKNFSVYINVFQLMPKGVFCFISSDYDIYDDREDEIAEMGTFFTKNIDENGDTHESFISEIDYNNLYSQSYKKGLFDFSQLWDKNPVIETEFKKSLCSFYQKDFVESHKLFCDDLILILSSIEWNMKLDHNNPDPILTPENLTKTFIDSLPDLGLIGIILKVQKLNFSENSSGSFVANDLVRAENSGAGESESLTKLRNSGFFKEKLFYNLIELFRNNFEVTNNFKNHKRLISEPVFNEIYKDISQTILDVNIGLSNVYVSSNRFITKRSYNFNDNTDFTNLLKEVEKPTDWLVNNCKEFISKWIKEFGIADELLLKPDIETGNFKASLRIGNRETQLADFGLGTNQLLPIIFSLGIHRYRPKSEVYGDVMIPRTVVIEEPEANLHPALQSKLADLFVDANEKFGVQIIAETHSEYLIRRMQYLVAKNELQNKNEDSLSIANDKVNIHYINAKLDEEGRKAYEINFTKNGQLTESFGKGFLDETTTLQFELYKLNNAQSN